MRGHQSAGLAAVRRRGSLGRRPVAVVKGDHQIQHALWRRDRTRRAAVHAHAAARGDVERAVRTRLGAASTLDERGRPAGDAHGPQQVGVEHQFARPVAVRDRAQGADGEPVQRRHRGTFLTGQPLGGLQHGASARVAAVVADDVAGERVDGLYLGDDVEVPARVQLNVDVRERLQPGPELAAGAAHALGHGTDQTVLAGEQGHDPVGLAELVLAQHHRPISVQPHQHSLPSRGDNVAEAYRRRGRISSVPTWHQRFPKPRP